MAHEDKTEAPTPQRRREAREKGQVAKSVDLTGSLTLLAGLVTLKSAMPLWSRTLNDLASNSLGHLSAFDATPEGVQATFAMVSLSFAKMVGPILGGILTVGVASNLAQVGWGFSPKALAPDFSRMNPLQGLARMVSPRGFMEMAKSLAKVGLVGWMAYAFLKSEQPTVVALGAMDRATAGRIAGDLIYRLCIRTCFAMFVLSAADYGYQRAQFEKSLRMTKQEVKEENKRSEGDPVIKAQFRQRHRQMARNRMMADVPTADVVVTNPTHYAVALKYDPDTMAAPVVIAKGQRLIAQRIKQIARENHVPLVENKPVARSLFASTKIGHPVPMEMYQAVAEILAFVYRLKHGIRGRTA